MAKKPIFLFLTGSAEDAADGVWDYTRCLAEALTKRGFSCACAAINDRRTDRLLIGLTNGGVPLLRLPSDLPWEERATRLSAFAEQHHCTCASLQFVPFSFQIKGLPWRLSGVLRRALPRVSFHIFFHETWVGFTRTATFKHQVWGAIQRIIIKRLLTKLRPVVVHTSNPLYVEILRRANIQAKRLPLFSNLIGESCASVWIATRLEELGISPKERSKYHLVGFFGACHPNYSMQAAIDAEAEMARQAGLRLAVLGVGGGGGTGEQFVHRVKGHAPEIVVAHWGCQPVANVLAFFKEIDVGLPTTPAQLLGKSGVAAAMYGAGLAMRVYCKASLPDYVDYEDDHLAPDDLFQSIDGAATAFLSAFNHELPGSAAS